MTRLTKEAYQGKATYAANKMRKNAIIIADEDFAEDIAGICELRHELHSGIARFAENITYEEADNSQLFEIISELQEFTNKVRFSEDHMYSINTYESIALDYGDMETFSGLTEEGDDLWMEEMGRISDILESINTDVENRLREIDAKYGTGYCPGGHTRTF